MAKVPEDPEIPDFNTNIAEVSESVTEAPDYDTFDFGLMETLAKFQILSSMGLDIIIL